ncbi:MAG: acyl-CoA dehydrogenase family protein [Desulfatiglandaceae bacterium]
MDFDLSAEQRDIRQAAREFALGELRDIAGECDQNETFPRELIKKAGELGFLGVFIDEAYGGAGLGFLEHAIILEEFWRVDPGLGQQLCSVSFGAEEFLLFGSEAQKQKFLSPVAEGKSIMGFAITEPDAGSDTLSAICSAVLDGDEYRINGSKAMIGNGSEGDFILVFCLTDPQEKARAGRHSIIAVETDRTGYEADPLHGKMGLRASDTANVFLSDVCVPKDNLIGERGNGFPQLMAFFDRSRAYVAAHGVGLAQGALDQAVAHVRSREQFGRKIGSFQSTQFKIADMATKVELARTLTHKACTLLDQGKGNTDTTAMAKMFSGRTAVEVVDEALQLHGGYGYFNDQDIERFYRAAKVLEIYEGAKEIEKMIIGRNVIGRL